MSGSIILGDFNSNKIWDKKKRSWNHSDVVKELSEIGIRSVYHEYFKIYQGQEEHPTFYLQRNLTKAYHIDYIFACSSTFPHIRDLEIGTCSKWLNHSDHLPIIATLDEQNEKQTQQ